MHYTNADIEYWLEKVLGSDEIEGLFVDDGIVDSYVQPTDYPIYTNLSTKNAATLDIDGAEVLAGATKLVIIPQKRNYVIKIPFTGTYHCERGEYDEDWNWISYDNPEVKFVSYTNNDVCDEEICLYSELSELTQSLVANNKFVFYYGNIPIYIQEKAYVATGYIDEDEIFPKYTKSRVEIAKKLKFYYHRYCCGFILRMMDTYGIKNTCNILDEVNENISDLHDENYGYRKDGSCLIFDTAGYSKSQWRNY